MSYIRFGMDKDFDVYAFAGGVRGGSLEISISAESPMNAYMDRCVDIALTPDECVKMRKIIDQYLKDKNLEASGK